MKLSVLVVALALVLASASASSAGIDVTPGFRKPSVVIKAETVKGLEHAEGIYEVATPRGTTNRAPYVSSACRVEESIPRFGCRQINPPVSADPDADAPELTQGDILTAVREIGLPSLQILIQPGNKTLVNIQTILYTRPQPFQHTITLLDHTINLIANPTTYHWIHGDGTTNTTTQPGRPYPAKDITHSYRDTHNNLKPKVNVTYTVKYRIDAGPWQTINQPLHTTGPTTTLTVRQAAPVLTTP